MGYIQNIHRTLICQYGEDRQFNRKLGKKLQQALQNSKYVNNIQMTNEHKKRCSTSLAIKEADLQEWLEF